jgi:hypothetical protein
MHIRWIKHDNRPSTSPDAHCIKVGWVLVRKARYGELVYSILSTISLGGHGKETPTISFESASNASLGGVEILGCVIEPA